MSQDCQCHSDPCTCQQDCGKCGLSPCGCVPALDMEDVVNLTPNDRSVCDGDTSDNVWFQPGQPGFSGVCRLDLMTYGQVYRVLQRNYRAKQDLLRVTTDRCLIQLANSTPLLVPPQEESEAVAKRLNAGAPAFYTVLCGNTDGTPNGRRR